MKKLLEKFNSMKNNYNLSAYSNPNGLITFKNKNLSVFVQYFHNMNFEKWFKYFIKQYNVKDILSVEQTKFGCLIVEVK